MNNLPRVRIVLFIAVWCFTLASTSTKASEPIFDWAKLPLLPSKLQVEGAFVGASNSALIVAGGHHQTPELEANAASYSARVYVLPSSSHEWHLAEQTLPYPVAHGTSAVWKDALICIGGRGPDRLSRDVLMLTWASGRLVIEQLPDLPSSAANCLSSVLNDTLYVVATNPEQGNKSSDFWKLDLSESASKRDWQSLEPCPGPPAQWSIFAAQDETLFLFSGTEYRRDKSTRSALDKPSIQFSYTPAQGWKRRSPLPDSIELSASSAVPFGQSHLVTMGYVAADAKSLPADSDEHRTQRLLHVIAYHTITDTWRPLCELPHEVGRSAKKLDSTYVTGMIPWGDSVVLSSKPTSQQLWLARRRTPKSALRSLDLLILVVYLVALVAIGLYFTRREQGTNDFFLGGQRVPWWAAGISIFGTLVSPISFMAIPAMVFRTNWTFLPGVLVSILVAPLVIAIYLPFFRRANITTAYEYLERRFDRPTRIVGSLVFIVSHLVRMGVVLYLPSLALAAVTGFNVLACILVIGVIATLYTVLGGIEAVIWTDVFQVIVLFGGLGISLVVITNSIPGGLPEIATMAYTEGKLKTFIWDWDATSAAVWVVLVGRYVYYLVGYSSDQTVIQRYLTTSTEKEAARAIWTNALLTLPAVTFFFGIGTCLWAFYKVQPEQLNPGAQIDQIFPWFIANHLPAGLSGLLIAALFAACMSSLDSSMNSIASAVTSDLYRMWRPHADDHACLKLARGTTLLTGLFATASALTFAWLESPSVWEQNLKLIGLFTGGLGGLFAAGIFSRRISGPGALLGFLIGVILLIYVSQQELVHFFLYVVIGFASCPLIGWLASWVLPQQKKDLTGLTIYSLPN